MFQWYQHGLRTLPLIGYEARQYSATIKAQFSKMATMMYEPPGLVFQISLYEMKLNSTYNSLWFVGQPVALGVILKTDSVVDGAIVVNKNVDYSSIMISAYEVDQEWDDRVLSHSDIVCANGK
ncbi:hypothetical protein B0H14DRAFT_2590166 [Mycena olivaceomarginata]|nr:hypothetical protein B0H14DRAFT_2590166 [Mycena olivaceomarginata]